MIEISHLTQWFLDNQENFALSVNKTKELIVDFKQTRREHDPIYINRTSDDHHRGSQMVHMHTNNMMRKAQQPLYNLWHLEKFSVSSSVLSSIESILLCCCIVWYKNCTVEECNAFQTVVRVHHGR